MSDFRSSISVFNEQDDDDSPCKNVFTDSCPKGWSLSEPAEGENTSPCECDTSSSDLMLRDSEELPEEESPGGDTPTPLGNVAEHTEGAQADGRCDWVKLSTEEVKVPDELAIELLPPEHPLLRKFQQSLKDYLTRAKDLLVTEIEELKHNMKEKELQREECGATLFDMQREIDRQNEQLEEFTVQIEEHVEKRRKEEEIVNELKTECDQQTELLKKQKNHYNQRMVELEHMQVLELNIRKWADEVEEEVKNAQRVVSRDEQLQKELSQEKKKSDLLLYHLDSEIKKSQKELQILQNESDDMENVLNSLRMSTAAANADLQALEEEHKHLTQAWGEVIVAISLRDRILYQAQVDMKKIQENIKNHTCGIEAANKLIQKEFKLNEKLMVFKKNLADSLGGLRNQCKQQSDVLDGLEKSLVEIPDILAKTEEEMRLARNEGLAIERDLRRLQTTIDQWNNKKYICEDALLKLAQDQLINDKASSYRIKLIRNAQETRRALELTLSQSQNQLANVLLQIEHYKSRIGKFSEENRDLQTHYNKLEVKANGISKELKRIELEIDMKMTRLEKLNNQVETIKNSEAPASSNIEIKIKLEEKEIQEMEAEIRKSQEIWIMLQNHYVNLTDKRNAQLKEVQLTKKQLSVIKQKSIKLDLELEKAEENTREINLEIRRQRTILEQMDSKIHKKQQEHENEEKGLETEHEALISKLKANEMEVLQIEEAINELHDEIGHYKDLVLDKHRESLSWETKYKLIEETLLWRKDEYAAQSELDTMRKEIHRMQIRYHQLKRVQEKLTQDLERGVGHREHVFMADSNKKTIESQKKNVKQSSQTLRHRISDLRGKLKQQQSQFELTDRQIKASQDELKEIEEEVDCLFNNVEQAAKDSERLNVDIENAIFQKHMNLEKIIRVQSRAKWYRRLSLLTAMDKLTRTESTIDLLNSKQQDMKENLISILQNIIEDHPEHKKDFRKLLCLLQED